MKQALLGSRLGRTALAARAAIDLLRAPKEALGMLANDQLAEHLVTRLCPAGGAFLDVGAHIGSIIAAVQHNCPSTRVEAVEAMPDKAERLRRKFPEVHIHCCALADRDGEASFFVNVQQSGCSSLAQSGDMQEIRVSLRTLDSLFPSNGFDLIKVDVEGAELGVLLGGERLIARSRPTIMFESGPEEVLGYTKTGIWSWLAERDYGVFVPNRVAHTGPPLSLEMFLDSHHYPRRTTNYFAVPKERREKVREDALRLVR